ncbi:MAG: urease accessory protein UreE [Aphanocapsa feldmannii 277cV]|uniref:Urease accessory protein UreE n=2 Tax=Aphanocapsa feldmannii TaxID=192050 RepID=A0A524RKW4_9CHRO|nr:MAG: urease accessory protein UreE [Aphanocapsa feldmannii 288cV]TGG90519.1 MAG: urease accessory protein UreE [Aphanocapsa feldmannii 277cV]TGH23998.1 MAG: urease accessory protein UreE [Aphanocapsa feldmannii 277cI]
MVDPPTEVPTLLTRRFAAADPCSPRAVVLELSLTAQERTRLRGHHRSRCGRDLILQLPRGGELRAGDWLADADGDCWVRVCAAAECLLQVTARDPLTLLQAAYHLGNRHVPLQISVDRLLLCEDSVLAAMLLARGLELTRVEGPFDPEAGAYGGKGHGRHP